MSAMLIVPARVRLLDNFITTNVLLTKGCSYAIYFRISPLLEEEICRWSRRADHARSHNREHFFFFSVSIIHCLA